jgi:hypothetical protein
MSISPWISTTGDGSANVVTCSLAVPVPSGARGCGLGRVYGVADPDRFGSPFTVDQQ